MGKKEKVKGIIILVLFSVVFVGIFVIYKFRVRLPYEFFYIYGIIGFEVMGLTSLVGFIKSIIHYRTRISKDTIIVKGIIVNHDIHSDGVADDEWVPVYEYYADGKIRRFQGDLAAGGTFKLGAEVKIAYNTVTRKAFRIYDYRDIKWINLIPIIIGFGVGALLLLKLVGII